MALLLQYTLIYASVLMLFALGGCFSEGRRRRPSGSRETIDRFKSVALT